jgi:hypothetical protein
MCMYSMYSAGAKAYGACMLHGAWLRMGAGCAAAGHTRAMAMATRNLVDQRTAHCLAAVPGSCLDLALVRR